MAKQFGSKEFQCLKKVALWPFMIRNNPNVFIQLMVIRQRCINQFQRKRPK